MSSLAAKFDREGYAILDRVLSGSECERLRSAVSSLDISGGGTRRLLREAWCRGFTERLQTDPLIASALPPTPVCAQCTLFRKTAPRNWFVPWHQDVRMPVRECVDHPALTEWSRKEDRWHVRPPVEVLESAVAVRVHLDDCEESHGPLRVRPRSHRQGFLAPHAIDNRANREEVSCVGRAGSVVLMKPLLLHASSKATVPNGRRVLHCLFVGSPLPFGLEIDRGDGRDD